MKRSVYIETTIISYLAARPGRDMVLAAHQEVTRSWWETRLGTFDIFISELVRLEAGKGDAEAAARRMAILEGLFILRTTDEGVNLAERLVASGAIPKSASGCAT